MAWTHRRSQRTASRRVLQRALTIDPQLWQRPQTCAYLRRAHKKRIAVAPAAYFRQ